jgi:hypothetical protein
MVKPTPNTTSRVTVKGAIAVTVAGTVIVAILVPDATELSYIVIISPPTKVLRLRECKTPETDLITVVVAVVIFVYELPPRFTE